MNLDFCYELKKETKQLKEEIVYLKELNNGLDYCAEQESLKSKNFKQKLDQVKKWYGINQIHIPREEAIKMISILKENV